MKNFLLVAFVLLGTALAGPAANANLVANGGFELLQPGAAASLYHICDNTGPSTCISEVTDWSATCSISGCTGTSTPGSILLAGTGGSGWNSGFGMYGPVPNSPAGGNFIGIDGDYVYSQTISQTISGLVPGDAYNLTFYQASSQQNGGSGTTTEQWEVSLGSETEYSTLIDNPAGSFTPWTEQTMTFVATSASEVLSFLALGTPSGEPPIALLDGVDLQQIPEPASIALLGVGLLGVGAVARRRRTTAGHAV